MKTLALALAAAVLVTAAPLTASAPETEEPSGLNAVANVATFAMAHPLRYGEVPTMQLAREYLVETLEGMGLEVIVQAYGGTQPGRNIIGLVRGTERPHDWLTITAHYDSVNMAGAGGGFLATAAGAWDDGAGVAAGLELARVAAQREWANTMAFVFFDDEEVGLIGSARFVGEFEGKAWEGGNIRLIGNLNMDPPGLNWPCGVEQGASYPVAFMQASPGTAGQTLLRDYMVGSKDEVGVPDFAYVFYGGSLPAFLVLGGTSDHVRFGNAGIPNMYIGSSVHIFLNAPTGTVDVPFMYPLHTPADSLSTMLAYCPQLDQGFDVAMQIVWRTMQKVDAYPGAFPN